MSELPNSWLTCTLGDVINYGSTQKAEPSEIPDDAWILELEDVEKDTSKILQRLTFKHRQSKSTKSRFEAGDILYGKLRPYLNKVVRADQGGYCTTEIIPIKSSEMIEGSYLFHWFKTPTFIDYVTSVSHGLNMPRLGTDAGKQAPFVLAPLTEQKRIADKLDAVLARVTACRDRLERIPAILKRFRQSVLAAATSGNLTADWRTENNITGSWVESTLLDLTTKITDGEHITPKRSSSGKFLLSARNIQNGSIALGNVDYVDDLEFDRIRRRCDPKIGDVLLSCSGSVGRVAMVDQDNCYVMVRSAAMIRPRKELLHTTYLMYCLQSPNLQAQIEEKSKATAQANIFLGAIKGLVLPLPKLLEQTEIVRRVESLFAHADHLEASYAAARTQVEKLTPSTLAKAFRGELVPQDPNDEPASQLLARIKASRPDKGSKRTSEKVR